MRSGASLLLSCSRMSRDKLRRVVRLTVLLQFRVPVALERSPSMRPRLAPWIQPFFSSLCLLTRSSGQYFNDGIEASVAIYSVLRITGHRKSCVIESGL